ncbi:MAG: HNH endonuclease [Renibacterium sp.]|nr:HNH endonuclease [Renibacterium sp.]
MGRRPSVESEADFAPAAAGRGDADAPTLASTKRAKQWILLIVVVLAISLIVTLGGLIRGALASSGSMVLPTPSGVPTVYVTDPPPPGPATDPGDQAPVEPAPASTVVPSGAVAPNPQPVFGTLALDLLARIPVQPAAPSAGYARSNFGPSWLDLGVGCDSRNATLKRDLGGVVLAQGNNQCIVQAGELKDPYSGGRLVFDRAAASMIQIDEVVSLANAWQTGAQSLSAAQRVGFANDALNLLAVDAVTSIQKHSADAAGWLPPNAEFRCAYVARQISVKATYGLWVTQEERDAMAAVLQACPTTTVPTNQRPADTGIAAGPSPDSAPAAPAAPAPQGTGQKPPAQKNTDQMNASEKKPAQKDSGPKPPVVVPPVPTKPSIPWLPPLPPSGDQPWPPNYFPVPPPLDPPFGPWSNGPGDWPQLPVAPPELPLLPGIDGSGLPPNPAIPGPPAPVPTVPIPTVPIPTVPSSDFGQSQPPATAPGTPSTPAPGAPPIPTAPF